MIALILAAAATVASHQSPPVSAIVTRKDAGFRVDYVLPAKSRAWVFPLSAPTYVGLKNWRSTDWRVTTRGVRLARFGAYDALVSENGRAVPRRVTIEFKPTSASLERENDPAISFNDGSTAIYSDLFDVAPRDDTATLGGKAYGLTVTELGGAAAAVTFRDGGKPVFVGATRKVDPVLAGAQTYVVYGGGAMATLNGVTMLADPALPAWLKQKASLFAPTVTAFYAEQLGPRVSAEMPLLLMGWRGATPGKVINDGGVRPGEVVLNFEGDGLVDPNPKAARRTEWFIAHEFAHFWLGTSGVKARTRADEWITEGGAEMAAFTLLARSDPVYVLAELQRAVDDCVQRGGKPVATAADRHDPRTLYACGTVLGMAAGRKAGREGRTDYIAFMRPLLDEHRGDRMVGGEDWFDHLRSISGDGRLVDTMKSFVTNGSSDPVATVELILARGGIAFRRTGDRIVLDASVVPASSTT